jgi:two-component system, cell cycle sensor histidine kinase and response regulator CckA
METLKVLILDDNADDRALVIRALRREFPWLKASEAMDSISLASALDEPDYGLVVTEYQLNWNTGLNLLPMLRTRLPDCPIIMFTATGNEEVAVKAMKAGVDDYVVKSPSHFVQLAATALAVVEKSRRRKRLMKTSRAREESLRDQRRMESVGRLAGGVAHDFNNLLTAINGNSELLLEKMQDNPPIRAGLVEIRSAGKRAADLTRDLLAFSRRQIFRPVKLDLNDLASSMEPEIRRILGGRIEYEAALGYPLDPILNDRSHLGTVIQNLVTNAVEAIPGNGKLTLITRNARVPEDAMGLDYESEEPGYGDEAKSGEYVSLIMADNGIGMDERALARLFEPFFTTKPMRKGMGLAVVHGIVSQSGGFISVESRPGHGTRFRIDLPTAASLENTEDAVLS